MERRAGGKGGGDVGVGHIGGDVGGGGGMFGSANQLTSPYMEDAQKIAHGYRPNLLKMIFLNRGTGCNCGTLLESLTG